MSLEANLHPAKDLTKLLMFTVLFSFPIFGQQIIGPENVHSARAMTMLAELSFVLFWLSRKEFYFFIPEISRLEKVLFSTWLVFAVVSVTFSEHAFVSAIRQMEWFTHILFVVALLSYFSENKLYAGHFIFSIALAFLVIGAYLLYLWHTIENPRQHNWFRHIFIFGHVRHMAYFALAGFCASFYLLLRSRPLSPFIFVVSVLLSSFCLSFVFWGGGRASIAAALISALFLIVASKKKRSLLTKFLIVVMLISSVSSMLYWVEDQRLGPSLNHGKELGSSDQITSGRFGIWGRVLSKTSESPLTGMGPDGYLFMPGKNIETLHPHSFIIQFIGDWGWIGAIAFIGFLFSLIGKRFIFILRVDTQQSPPLVVASSVVLSLSLLGLVDGTYYHSWSVMLLASGIAVMFCPVASSTYSKLDSGMVSVKRPIALLTSVLTTVAVFQISVSAIVLSPAIPSPNSLKATIVKSFPSNTIGLDRWLNRWYETYPFEALDWAQFLQVNSKDGWYYYLLESEFRNRLGDVDKANELFITGVSKAPRSIQQKISGAVSD